MRESLFMCAKAVWQQGKERELNYGCAFVARFKKIQEAVLYITASSFYKAYLNGEFLGFGPARATHGYFRVDELPLTKQKEENILFVEVVGYNTRGYYTLDQSAFLQAEIRQGEVPIMWTGKDFIVRNYAERRQKVKRFSFQRTFTEYYDFNVDPKETYLNSVENESHFIYEEPIEVFGGKLLPRGVNYPLYTEYPSCCIERGTFTSVSKKIEENTWLQKRELKIFSDDELSCDPSRDVARYVYKKESLVGEKLSAGEYMLFDLNSALTGFIKIELQANLSSDVLLIFDELNLNTDHNLPAEIRYDRNGCINIIGYNFSKPNWFSHASFEPYTARYIKVLVRSGEISHVKISVIAYENPNTENFYFNCSDERLCTIVEAARNTFKQNAVDILMDCPSRERAGWLCDSYFSGKAEQLFTGKNLVEKNFLDNYALMPKMEGLPEDMIPMCYPSEIISEPYIPNWAMWYIIELRDFGLRTGDQSIIEKSRGKVEGILRFLQKYENESGLLENLDGWVFLEWSRANDKNFIEGVNYPTNMLYALSLEMAGTMYDNCDWIMRAEQIRKEIRIQSYNGKFFEDNRVRQNGVLQLLGHTSETCQYYAFFSKVATPELYPELYHTMLERFGAARDEEKIYPAVYKSNAFIGNYLRLIILAENGMKGKISTECLQYFYHMAVKTGTLWENDKPTASLDHCFASYAANLIVDYMIGFKALHGNEILFSKAACSMDCEIHIPVGEELLIYKRINGVEKMVIPNGYRIKNI